MRADRAIGSKPIMKPSRSPVFLAAAGSTLCLALAACGTDVHWLLKRDSALVAEADRIATAAEAVDPNLTTDMYDAEDAKRAACQTIYQSISEGMTRPPTFGEQLVADLGLFVAYLVPIEEIERCAEAEDAYEAAVKALANRIGPASSGGAPN